MPIGAVVIAMFLWLLIVFVIRKRKRVTFHLFPSLIFTHRRTLRSADWSKLTTRTWLTSSLLYAQLTFCCNASRKPASRGPKSFCTPALILPLRMTVASSNSLAGVFIMRAWFWKTKADCLSWLFVIQSCSPFPSLPLSLSRSLMKEIWKLATCQWFWTRMICQWMSTVRDWPMMQTSGNSHVIDWS